MRKSVFAFLLIGYMSEHQTGCKEAANKYGHLLLPPSDFGGSSRTCVNIQLLKDCFQVPLHRIGGDK
jgi:hypothetical protein